MPPVTGKYPAGHWAQRSASVPPATVLVTEIVVKRHGVVAALALWAEAPRAAHPRSTATTMLTGRRSIMAASFTDGAAGCDPGADSSPSRKAQVMGRTA